MQLNFFFCTNKLTITCGVFIVKKVLSPPTKGGKKNDYRQTNARTVYIIKYINKIWRIRQKKAKKRIRFEIRFCGTKIPVQTP